MEEIYIKLTEPQIRALDSLWVQVDLAHLDNEKGAILALQPRDSGFTTCVFVPHKQAKKIKEIMKEIE